ncbi:MAG TPA: protein kinase [Kofleriaceae bacterium]|nr:protein kinase [Kofleriaceae bacterium]
MGRYQLLEPIGIGPCGTVSRAKVFGVAGFERQFAVKRFHTELTSTAQLAQALSAAARAYGGLEHPRIARMSEFGVAQGVTFTAVELVTGLDALRLISEAKIAGTSVAAGGALALVSQAARAIGYAHGRGLTHLGLSPTNVLVNAEGDVKITDFGILSATLPPRPIEVQRLAQRIQYLAPEQLANEATSAATDVFALGVLAYELVTGQRTFKGDTPQQVAQSVMAGPPGEPPLPRPIVRVLQRCLARSPFERFPDARAFADALDAALRVAPVPGTRKDIGALVKHTLDRIADMHSGELSGMVALDLPAAAHLGNAAAVPPSLGHRDSEPGGEFATTEFVRPDTPVAGPSPLVGPSIQPDRGELDKLLGAAGNTVPDLPKSPFTTVAGLPPPPIPVPQGVASPPSSPPPPAKPTQPNTLIGIQNAQSPARTTPLPSLKSRNTPPAIPAQSPTATPPPLPVVGRTVTPPPMPAVRMTDAGSTAPMPSLGRASTAVPPPTPPPRTTGSMPALPRTVTSNDDARAPTTPEPPKEISDLFDPSTLAHDEEDAETALALAQDAETALARPADVEPHPRDEFASRDQKTNEMPPLLAEQLSERASKPTSELAPIQDANANVDAWRPPGAQRITPAPHVLEGLEGHTVTQSPPPAPERSPFAPPLPGEPFSPVPASTVKSFTGEREAQPSDSGRIARGDRTPLPARPQATTPPPAKSRAPWIVLGTIGALGLGTGAFFLLDRGESTPPAKVASSSRDAGASSTPRIAIDAGAVATAIDAAAPVVAAIDAAATKAPADAEVATAPADASAPPPASGELTITSTPKRARVFIDGSDAGLTPLTLPGSSDRHTIALLLPGHELYVAQVDGRGTFAIPLKEVTPTGGDAGIKVTKCKDKERYYVFVDGKPTGQTCPTERIDTEVGPHTVEVYDVVSETRRKWEIDVKDTRLSVRVRIDP